MTAHKNTRKSPFDMENPSVIHRKYIPATASATPIQTFIPALLPKKSPRTGTINMYRAVINPAFPALVYTRPICWRELAAARAVPQQMPPMTSVFLSHAAAFSSPLFSLCLRMKKMTGRSTAPPRKLRTELNVNGPR